MTNSSLLRQKIEECGFKLKYVAEQLNITPYTLQLKINNEREFKTGEVKKLCEILNITELSEREQIFFAS